MSGASAGARRPRPFRKVLIANRGEIACRIARTCRRLGIRTVAVHSEADADALHVETADEAVAIGLAPADRSYLSIEAILEAARTTGAEAVHPGYGFLSENAAFARAVERAGLAFVGPRPATIALMGDKLAAKALARKAGVDVVPGDDRPAADVGTALRMAGRIGYPVMLKAAAGGGGKGMRIVHDAKEAREEFPRAAGEAQSSFGDGRIFVERYFPHPRHIEVQVLADAGGNCISLGTRECSIQRRHQKVIEEAPAPALDPETGARMEAQAVRLAKAAKYRSAGTVEFVLDAGGDFHFLEMNTRLQVEHPVTEMVTGTDLVEEMLHVAAGAPLALRQEDVAYGGWAIEARVYAEDPVRGFLPSIGRIRRLVLPPPPSPERGTLRIDSGVVEGSEITPHYDPMIAKVVAHGPDRPAAVGILGDALDAFHVRGPGTNLGFLADVVRRPRFRRGRLDTGFIAREYPKGFGSRRPRGRERDALVAAAALIGVREEMRAAGTTGPRDDGIERALVLGDETIGVHIHDAEDGCDVQLGDHLLAVRSDWSPGEPVFRGLVNSRAVSVQVDPAPEGHVLSHGGTETRAALRRPEVAALGRHMPARRDGGRSGQLRSPMPGLVLAVEVKEGDRVGAGQVVAVVEAMKVENALRAEHDGTVKAVRVSPGDNIAADDVIAEFA